MKEIYKKPEADVICFAPAQAIALDHEWGWEDGVFDSTPEARTIEDDEDAERRVGYEG